uniref:Uncharacterized protein n=1 Tax=Picea glauca TaxID=3330 RepID=A0A101M0N4_PICGL|nr:hypothetical protein ABT39_MTgene4187 [Picea glauca]
MLPLEPKGMWPMLFLLLLFGQLDMFELTIASEVGEERAPPEVEA